MATNKKQTQQIFITVKYFKVESKYRCFNGFMNDRILIEPDSIMVSDSIKTAILTQNKCQSRLQLKLQILIVLSDCVSSVYWITSPSYSTILPVSYLQPLPSNLFTVSKNLSNKITTNLPVLH